MNSRIFFGVLGIVAVTGCNSILGIEEHSTRAGGGGQGEAGSTAGEAGSTAGEAGDAQLAGAAGHAGQVETAGAPTSGAGSGGEGATAEGGTSGSSGTPQAGASGGGNPEGGGGTGTTKQGGTSGGGAAGDTQAEGGSTSPGEGGAAGTVTVAGGGSTSSDGGTGEAGMPPSAGGTSGGETGEGGAELGGAASIAGGGMTDGGAAGAGGSAGCTVDLTQPLTCSAVSGHVVRVDSCGQEIVVDPCVPADDHGTCRDGVCGCAPGFTGPDCEQCTVFVNGNAPSASDTDNDGLSWDSPFETVQAGIDLAASRIADETDVDSCEVWVGAGTYLPSFETEPVSSNHERTATFLLHTGVPLYGGFAGTEALRSDRPAWTAPTSTLSGDVGAVGDSTDNAYHVVTGADSAILDGFAIEGGMANADTEPFDRGGGMYNVLADANISVSITDCEFRYNQATTRGGAMYSERATVTVSSSRFNSNSVSGAGDAMGGAIAGDTTALLLSDDTAFNRNQASSTAGSAWGGAVFLRGSLGGRLPTISDSTFWQNSVAASTSGAGGAIYVENGYQLTLSGCTLTANTVVGGDSTMGGALYSFGLPLTIENTVLTNNQATSSNGQAYGGGISHSAGALAVRNSVFARNKVSGVTGMGGGGLSIEGDTNIYATLTNCTLYGNESWEGVHDLISGHALSLLDAPHVSLYSSIIWDNLGSADSRLTWTTTAVELSFCDVVAETPDPDQHIVSVDPGFTDADADDFTLASSSPCIDAGNGSGAPDLDLLGNSRVDIAGVDNGGEGSPDYVDMGAYEYQQP